MHSVFARDVRYAGVDDWDDFNHRWLLEFKGTCPQCGRTINAHTQCGGSGCDCEGVYWDLNISVTTTDLPASNWSRSQVRTRALQVIAEAAGELRTKKGKTARQILAELIKDFGRKAVDEAIAAEPVTEENGSDESLTPPQELHTGQQSLAARISVEASFWQMEYQCDSKRATFSYHCPTCYHKFLIATDTLVASCKCEGVTWRMNLSILTSDMAPHSWHPEAVRQAALRELHSRSSCPFGHHNPKYCETCVKLWDLVKKEFDSESIYTALKQL
jgi:hypothetical protein